MTFVDVLGNLDIVTSTITSDAGITIHDKTAADLNKAVAFFVSGGVVNTQYEVNVNVVTDGTPPRTFDKMLIVKIENV